MSNEEDTSIGLPVQPVSVLVACMGYREELDKTAEDIYQAGATSGYIVHLIEWKRRESEGSI